MLNFELGRYPYDLPELKNVKLEVTKSEYNYSYLPLKLYTKTTVETLEIR